MAFFIFPINKSPAKHTQPKQILVVIQLVIY
jgi:hypothetical protein